MKLSDDILMAYADNEVDAETRAAVEAAMAADPEVAQRVERHKALRAEMRAAFEGVLREPVPERLVTVVQSAPAGPPRKADVTDLARARAARHQAGNKPRWSLPEWGAMAASLILGMFLGYSLLRPSVGEPVVARDGRLVAQGVLEDALSNQLASDQGRDSPVQIGLSFAAKSGEYCRAFSMPKANRLAGLACREDGGWIVRALSQNEAPAQGTEGYRQAGSALPTSVLQAVNEQIRGEPLDAAGEIAAQAKDWKR